MLFKSQHIADPSINPFLNLSLQSIELEAHLLIIDCRKDLEKGITSAVSISAVHKSFKLTLIHRWWRERSATFNFYLMPVKPFLLKNRHQIIEIEFMVARSSRPSFPFIPLHLNSFSWLMPWWHQRMNLQRNAFPIKSFFCDHILPSFSHLNLHDQDLLKEVREDGKMMKCDQTKEKIMMEMMSRYAFSCKRSILWKRSSSWCWLLRASLPASRLNLLFKRMRSTGSYSFSFH